MEILIIHGDIPCIRKLEFKRLLYFCQKYHNSDATKRKARLLGNQLYLMVFNYVDYGSVRNGKSKENDKNT